MDEEDIVKNCHYVPLSSLQKAMNLLENPYREPDKRCKRNLVHLQTNRSLYDSETKKKNWRNAFQIAVRRAIYSHAWDRLAYLLRKSPIWEHSPKRPDEIHIYLRALTILLMYHPSAKAQLLLNEYLHLVLSCRSDQDKKAVYKVLLTLQDKIGR